MSRPWSCRSITVRRGQRCFVVDEGPVLRRAVQLPQQALGAVVQDFCSQQEAFPSQTVGERTDVLRSQGHPEHLAGCLRQLVGLVHDEGAGVRQDGLSPAAPVDGVRQQQVVVADLEKIPPGIALLQKETIPAGLLRTVADLGDADTFPVIVAEMGDLVHVQLIPQRKQGIPGPPVFLSEIQLAQPPFQTVIADIVGLSLADHRLEGLCNHAVLRQQAGQQGEIFVPCRGLEGNAGGGDQNRSDREPTGGAEAVVHYPSHQIGVGLADPRPSVTQGDAALQHGVQHPMAERQLLRALCHVPSGE